MLILHLKKDTLYLNHITILDVTENSLRDTKKGQKDVWTAKNGLVNIYSKVEIYEIYECIGTNSKTIGMNLWFEPQISLHCP